MKLTREFIAKLKPACEQAVTLKVPGKDAEGNSVEFELTIRPNKSADLRRQIHEQTEARNSLIQSGVPVVLEGGLEVRPGWATVSAATALEYRAVTDEKISYTDWIALSESDADLWDGIVTALFEADYGPDALEAIKNASGGAETKDSGAADTPSRMKESD